MQNGIRCVDNSQINLLWGRLAQTETRLHFLETGKTKLFKMNTTETTIAAALLPAYQAASKLKITKTEAKALMRPFNERDIEILESGAIILPHIFMSERLNQVFGPCAWSLIETGKKIDEDLQRVWADYILIIRGCYVGQASGEFTVEALEGGKMSDALEATKASALRRICKQLSCGNELWKPEFIEKWQAKYAETRPAGDTVTWHKKGAKVTFSEGSDAPKVKDKKPKANENFRHIMLEMLSTQGNANVLQYALVKGILQPNQNLQDWPLDKVAITEQEIRKLQIAIQEHFAPAQQALNWKTFEIPFGGMKGQKLSDVAPEAVAGYWSAFDEKNTINAPTIKKYPEFKKALDEAALHYNFQDLKGKS